MGRKVEKNQNGKERVAVMKRVGSLVLVLVLALWAVPGLASAQPVNQSASDLLQALPDGQAVLVIDSQKITSSDLWSRLSAQKPLKGIREGVQGGLNQVGLRLADIQTVAVVFPAGDLKTPVLAARGAFNPSDIVSRLRGDQKVKVTSERYRDLDVYIVKRAASSDKAPSDNKKPARTEEGAFAFLDSSTVVAGTQAGVRASIDTRAGDKPSIAQNAKLSAALAEYPGAALRFAAVVTPVLTKSLESNSVPLPSFSTINFAFGALDIATGIDINLTLRNDTAEHATAIADQLNGILAMLKGLLGASGDPKLAALTEALKSVSITSVGIDVKITGSLPGELLAQALR
jgi:hypothetical protein